MGRFDGLKFWKRQGIYLPSSAVADPNPDFAGDRQVVMLRTVASTKGGWEYLAGRPYALVAEKADEWLIKGYAVGKLSRNYTPEERSEILAGVQTIDMATKTVRKGVRP